MKKKNVLIALLCGLYFSAQAQTSVTENVYPEVGKVCPDFELHNIRYFKTQQANLKDFKGQWLVLDFWNKYCGGCVASFPIVSNLQKQFAGKVQFMMVGIQDPQSQIEPMYAKYHEYENLAMPCAFDSTLANRFDIYTAPYVIVIDPNGVVRTITYGLDADDVQAFLDGKTPRLMPSYRVHQDRVDNSIPFDAKKPFLVNGNGGPDSAFIFRSLLSAFDGFRQRSYVPRTIGDNLSQGQFQVLGVPLYRLYNYAYYGKVVPDSGYQNEPVLEIKDSSWFDWSTLHSRNLFSYSVQVPVAKATTSELQHIMQKDLETYFGYHVTIEKRAFPCCWHLIAKKEARKLLKTRGGATHFEWIPKVDFKAQNWPFKNLVSHLQNWTGARITDETGITGNIDIEMHALLFDIKAVRASLQKWGLDLVPATEEYKVLVIKDNNH